MNQERLPLPEPVNFYRVKENNFPGSPESPKLFAPQCPPPTVDTPQPAHPGWAVLSAQLTRMGREGSRQATWITVLLPCLECTGKQGEPHLSTHD